MKTTTEKSALTYRHATLRVFIALLCIGLLVGVAGAATTSVDVIRIHADGSTVLAKETVTVDQMKADFPIMGDGITKYTHQGPIFEGAWEMAVEEDPDYAGLPYDKYDPLEKINWEDGMAAYRGTSVKDLASLVGGIPDDVKVGLRASDGMERKFSGSYINNPDPRMGPMVICWERDGSTTDKDLMRMYFFADDHVFGATDMHETMPDDEYWYNNQYPSARGVSVQNVKQIRIYTTETSYTPKTSLTTYDRAVTLDTADVVIPADKISSNTPADTTVPGNSLAGIVYKTFPNDVEFWAGGQNGSRFNLNSLLGKAHKTEINGVKYYWDVFVDGVKQNPTHWGTDAELQFTNGQLVQLKYENEEGSDVKFIIQMKVLADATYIYDNKVDVGKTGTFKVTVGDTDYEVPWNSPAGILKALDFDAAYKITQKGAMNFNAPLTDKQRNVEYAGYINAYNADDTTKTIDVSTPLAPGSVIYIQVGGEKGVLAGSDALIKAELIGGGLKATWPLILSGVVEIPVDKAYFEESAAPSHSRVEYTDASGNVWNGVPMRLLAGMVDEIEPVGTGHYTFSTERATAGYPITLTAGNGTTASFNANVLPATRTATGYSDAYILADTLNGQKTALTFTGSAVAENLVDVRNITFDVSAFESEKENWEIALEGRIKGTLNDTDTYAIVGQTFAPPTHNVSYTDAKGDEYLGVGMSTLIGWVDDEHPHGLNAETLAGGVTITFIKDDSTKYTIDSDEIKDTIKSSPNKVFIAVYKNGEKINPTVVGSGVSEANTISGITKITFTDYRNPPDVEGITVIKHAADGSVVDQKYYTWQQLRDTFTVIGEGTTVYSIQGPVMGAENLALYGMWDENEAFPASSADKKYKVMDAVKGTSIKELADSVGGMNPGDYFKLTACDGFSKTFKDGYRYLYNPDARMGTMFLAWSNNGVDGPNGYKDMMRLFFTADNDPADDRVFSLWDMHESMAEDDWGWYSGTYPSTAELSVYKLNKLELFTAATSFSYDYEISAADVVIPAESINFINASEAPKTVGGNTLAAAIFTALDDVKFCYKAGDHATYFNLDAFDGHVHKTGGKWYGYIDDVEVSANEWDTVTLSAGNEVKLVYRADSGVDYTYTIAVTAATPVYTIIDGNVVIPAASIAGSDDPVTVGGNTLAAGVYTIYPTAEFFYKEGESATFFNLNSYDGHTHKSPNKSDKWFAYVNDIEVTADQWSDVVLKGGDAVKLVFDNQTEGKQYTYAFSVEGGIIGTLIKIPSGPVTIPASSINGSDDSAVVAGDSLLGVLAQVPGIEFYKGGNQGMYFNLNSYDGHIHKTGGKWKTYINDEEVTAPDWSVVTVYDKQVIHLEFTETEGTVLDYYFTTSGGTAAGWTLKLVNGKSEKILTQDEFETLAAQYAAYPCVDELGTWNGVPLYVLAGYVDDADAATFNTELANIGYSIRVSDSGKPTPYSINFDSKNIANNNTIIVANSLNGEALPEKTPNGKGCFPLQMKGVSAGSGQSIGNISTIELVDVPDANKFLLLSGKMEYYLTKEQYDSSLNHHAKTINGYTGMPLYLLVAIVDDIEASIPGKYDSATGHFSLNTDLIANNGYKVVLTDGNGQTYEIPCSEFAGGRTVGGNYIIAKNADGTLTLAGNSVTTPFNNVKSIKLVGTGITGDGWSILVNGPDFGIYLTQAEFENAAASSYHAKSYTDTVKSETWSGVNLATIVGFVDDFDLPMPGESHAGAFNNLLAQTGYKIIVTSGDGYSAEIDSKDLVANKDAFLVANKVNNAALTGKNTPLRIVGSGVYDTAAGKFSNQAVGGIAKIELKEFAAPVESPTIKIIKLDTAGNIVTEKVVKWSDIWADPVTYPVIGDGTTVYGYQGLAQVDGEKYGQGVGWDLNEEELEGNWKISEAVKGTAVSKLTDIVGGMNPTDEIEFICSKDGWTTTLNYSNIYTPHERQGTAFLAWYADGKTMPEYKSGARLYFTSNDNVLSQADMYYAFDEAYWHYNSGKASAAGLSAQKVDVLKIVPKAEDWSITLKGAITETIDKNYFEDGLSCTFTHGGSSDHQAYYIDEQGHKWGGMPLFLLAGFVDDDNSHQGKSFNTELAAKGYKITVFGANGTSTVIDSRDVVGTGYIVANTVDGKTLTEEEGWPLKLVGSSVSAADEIKGITSIELDLTPLPPSELEYDNEVTLSPNNITVGDYSVAGNTVLGIIAKSGLQPIIGDKKWESLGILLFDGIEGYPSVKGGQSWKITCNDVEINGYNEETKAVAVNIYEVHVGDVIHGQILANDGVSIAQQFTITVVANKPTFEYDKEVVLSHIIIKVAEYDVPGNSVLGIIAKSGLDVIVGDKKWESDEILLFDGLVGFPSEKNVQSWTVTQNGVAVDGYNAETKANAINVKTVKAGDIIKGQFILKADSSVIGEFEIKVLASAEVVPENVPKVEKVEDKVTITVPTGSTAPEVKDGVVEMTNDKGFTFTTVFEDEPVVDVTNGTVTGKVAEFEVSYPETAAVSSVAGVTVGQTVELNLGDNLDSQILDNLPIVDGAINEEVVDVINDSPIVPNTQHVLSMVSAEVNEVVNEVLKEIDGSVAVAFDTNGFGNGKNLKYSGYHVDGDTVTQATIETIDSVIVVKGSGWSSYVLCYEEGTTPVIPKGSSGSSGDTGSGNYHDYPRTVANGGEVDFGTSKVVTGVILPTGTNGGVALHLDDTSNWPSAKTGKEYIFSINVDNLGDGNSVLKYKIAKTALANVGSDATGIAVYHKVNDEWQKLDNKVVSEDKTCFYYEAVTPSFSTFKLVLEENGAVNAVQVPAAEPVAEVTQKVTEVGTAVPTVTKVPTAEPTTEPTQAAKTPVPVLGLFAGLIGTAIVLRRM